MKSQLRIGAGELRGRTVAVPAGVRPTSARVRESLCDIWARRLPGARVLDLFAGSGAIGLEALSRGAEQAVLVEGDPRVCPTLEQNARLVASDRIRILRLVLPEGLSRWPRDLARGFDLIFADPPYDFEAFGMLFAAIGGWLGPGAELAIEHAAGALDTVRSALELKDRRRYGDSWLSFFGSGRVDQS